MRNRKLPSADLKRSYTLYLQTGLIAALLVLIAAVKLNLETSPPDVIHLNEQDIFELDEIVQTKHDEVPPPPLRPQVPVEVPNDEIIEDEIIDLESEFNLDDYVSLPPPPDDDDPEEDFFIAVEQQPELIGGMKKLQSSVNYPDMARRAGIEGRVTIQFIVNKNGNVENARVLRGISKDCDQEALKAVQKAKFKPGMQQGRPVPVQMSLNINFRLDH